MTKRVPITRAGYENMRRELDRLIRLERPRAIKAIEEARSHGDLTENAEYQAAREHQALVEARIRELQAMMSSCQLVDYPLETPEKVVFGTRVSIEDQDTGEQQTIELVGPYESDPQKGLVSVTSPLGQALIGKKEGDLVSLETPGGLRRIQVLEIGRRGMNKE